MFSDLTIAYLFLGGVGSGALVILSVLALFARHSMARSGVAAGRVVGNRAAAVRKPSPTRSLWRSVTRALPASFWARCHAVCAATLILGSLCLAFDLPDPTRSYLLFLNPHPNAMSVGAFALALSALLALVLALAYASARNWPRRLPIALLHVLALLSGIVTAVYPGILLMAMPADVAWHSWLVPVLFTLSALSTGVALVWLCHVPDPGSRPVRALSAMLAPVDSALIATKVIATVLYLVVASTVLSSSHEVDMLLRGSQSYIFWAGYAACGLVLPLILEWLLYQRPSAGRFALTSLLILVGGLCLRVAVVLLGS